MRGQGELSLVCKVDVLHSYFEHNTCTCLTFKPTAATAGLFNRFGWLMRYKVNGFDLYCTANQSLEDLLNYMASGTNSSFFAFDIATADPSFSLFTDLRVDWVGQLRYDSNSAVNTIHQDSVELGKSLAPPVNVISFGQLTLHFADLLKFRSAQHDTQFNIIYKARATQWQYFVFNTSNVLFDQLAIAGHKEISFEGPDSVFTESGQPAWLFTSGKNLIPLSQQPSFRLDLVHAPNVPAGNPLKKTAAPKIIFKGLPYPDPGRIGKGIGPVKNVVSSPMYIYL